MTEQPVGPRCGNNPNMQLTPGDRKAVDDFKARLALQADARPYLDSAVWVDGDPLMEVIAVTVYERCETGDGGIVHDDPRTIAAFAAAVARAHAVVPSAPADRAAILREAADAVAADTEIHIRYGSATDYANRHADLLRRMAGEAQGADRCSACRYIPCDNCRPAAAGAAVAGHTGDEGSEAEASPVCQGFQWIGQSFATCDRCGQPAWEHDGEDVPVEGAGPFDTRSTVRPWKPGQADAMRAKWGTPAAGLPAGGAPQPKEADAPRSVCVCGHTRAEHLTVSGRLLCDACDPDSTSNLVCRGFDAL